VIFGWCKCYIIIMNYCLYNFVFILDRICQINYCVCKKQIQIHLKRAILSFKRKFKNNMQTWYIPRNTHFINFIKLKWIIGHYQLYTYINMFLVLNISFSQNIFSSVSLMSIINYYYYLLLLSILFYYLLLLVITIIIIIILFDY